MRPDLNIISEWSRAGSRVLDERRRMQILELQPRVKPETGAVYREAAVVLRNRAG